MRPASPPIYNRCVDWYDTATQPVTPAAARTRCEHHVTGSSEGGELAAVGYDDRDRQALLAIYQAGKPDMMFHTRAPSSAALEKMLVAVADVRVRDATTNKCLPPPTMRDRLPCTDKHRYTGSTPGRRNVTDDVTPVKVKVECPPRSDTVVSFRVTSKAT